MNGMGGLCEERFGRSGKGVENKREGWGSGDDSETGLVKKMMIGIGVSLSPDDRDKEKSNKLTKLLQNDYVLAMLMHSSNRSCILKPCISGSSTDSQLIIQKH